MHTLIALSTLLPVLLGGAIALRLLRRVDDWTRRRDLQLLILAAPLASLALALSNLPHYVSRLCFPQTPAWDYALGVAIPLLMGLGALGGLSLGLLRLGLMAWVMARHETPAGPALQTVADRLALRLSAPRARVLVFAQNQPLAFTTGLWRSRILLSTWMVAHFDARELEAVVAHELGHHARHDYLVGWLAVVLRDGFCYLPTSQRAYRQVQQEKELACDDLAAGATARPLALASALAKTWQHAVGRPRLGLAQPLLDGDPLIESRIERLLQAPPRPDSTFGLRLLALGVGFLLFAALVVAESANIAALFTPLNCGPI